MRFTLSAALSLLASTTLVAAQTFTDCNPTEKSCPPDPAFGQSDKTFDFTSGASGAFRSIGAVTYDNANGATFTIAKQGDGPLIQSGWYIMFGRVEFKIKAAAGTGIVSSAVLQSDDLDEIDWEWLGGNNAQVQTNYFGKGDTTTYSRGAYHENPGNHDDFHTYSIDWTSDQIVWAIDGKTVRVLTPETAGNQYPQTPMMIKVGVWAGGDPNNAQGTIDWAGGRTDYSQGPFKMYLKSMTVTDYSTGTSYSYGDRSGSWKSIVAEGGKVNGNKGAEPASTQSAPEITATVDSAPVPWSGTHRETSSWVTPNVWPWVASGSPTASATGWQFDWESASGQNKPPSGGSVSEDAPACFTASFSSSSVNIETLTSQSTFRSMSPASPSSSVAFSRSGVETSKETSILSVTQTSSSTESTTATTFTTSPPQGIATKSSGLRGGSPVGNAGSQVNVPAMAGALSLFYGIVALL